MKRFAFVVAAMLVALQLVVAAQKKDDPVRELGARLRSTLWQWDGAGGETVLFQHNGYVENEGWTRRGLITRWDAIDRRTVLLRVERGRTQDLYAVLVFKEDLSSFSGFNFTGGSRLRVSREIHGRESDRTIE